MEIFVVRAGALGDAVITLPFFRALKEGLPSSRISVVGSASLIELLRGSPWADALYRLDDVSLGSFFSQNELSREWTGRLGNASFVFLLMEDSVFFRKAGLLCPRTYMAAGIGRGDSHAGDSMLRLLSRAGIKNFREKPGIHLSREDRSFADEFLEINNLSGENTASIHPGSGSAGKNWPAERFASVAESLVSDFGMRIAVPAGEADENAVKGFLDAFREDEAVVMRGLALKRLAAVLERCRLYIGNDSGVSHLAAAAGVPSVCVFGPTDPRTWAPRGEIVSIVRNRAPCSPCSSVERNSCTGRVCLLGTLERDVYSAAKTLLR